MISPLKKRNPAKIKFFLYFIIATICLSVVAVFVNYRYLSGKDPFFSILTNKATLSLNNVDHTQTKAGVKQCRLKAGTVNYFQDTNKAIFTDLNVIVYSKDNSPTTITAKNGQLNTATNDITATGNVRVVNGDFSFETETLNYNSKERILSADVPVKFLKDKSQITANTVSIDLNTNIMTLKGNVKGTFSGSY
ncbi:MAG: LPS export ABC transporter periplasmic protein LptC [Desulfobacteraceae bacterium]|nr:LPS export ABC transporter periplasmic protein LptC [Desulfobacteraceae bacterium]